MKEIHFSSQYKKDFKRYRNKLDKVAKILAVVQMLARGEELPVSYRAHKLTGNFNDHMEYHIEGDTLLIWMDKESDIIRLVRLGSHSELFK